MEFNENPSNLEGLPTLESYEWTVFLQRCVDCGETRAQKDVLWISTLAILGATVAPFMSFAYSHKKFHPSLQTFIVAPSASGKGVVSWVYRLGEPLQQRYRKAYAIAMEQYKKDYAHWGSLGKDRAKEPEPEKPPMKLFYISGNNTGTGILENLADAKGTGE